MQYRNLVGTVLVLLSLFSLSACGNNAGTAVNNPSSGAPAPPSMKLTEPPSPQRAEEGSASDVVNGITVPLNQGWNGVAFQSQILTALSANPLIPGFAWWNGASYQLRNFSVADFNAEGTARRGFFIFALTNTSFTYSGTDDGFGNFLNLGTGYNLVSFTNSAAIPGSSLSASQNGSSVPLGTVILPQFQEVGPDNRYSTVDVNQGGVLRPGRPYWVFAASPVRLSWPGPSPSPTPTATASPTTTPTPSGSPASSPAASPAPSP